MEKIRKLLFLFGILLIIVVIIILITHRKTTYEDIDGIGATEEIKEYNIEKVESASVYYTVENYINRYVKYLSLDLTDNKSDSNSYLEIHTNEEKYEYIYNILLEDYKKNNNITLSNINEYISITNEPLNFTALDMNSISYDNTRIYGIYGRIEKENTNELVGYEYFKLVLDIENMTYAIEPINNCNDINEIDMSEVQSIPKTQRNAFNYLKISEVELVNKYFMYYKDAIINYPEEIYNKLSSEYKEAKFKNLNEFKQYVNNRKDELSTLSLKKYNKSNTKDYTRFVFMDNYGNYYILNSYAIMQFDILLDTYTIDLPEFTEKYETATTEEKVMLNIQKIVEALNGRDYNYIYSKLADEFKENYFKTYEDFEKYAKETFDIGNEVTFNKYTESENLSTYEITLKGKSKTITKTIVMKLEEGTDFVMSFNVE